MATATDTPNPSEPHPYAFRTMPEARQTLRDHMYAAEKSGLQDLRRITDTIGALAYALTESSDMGDQRIGEAWYYLSDQLADATSALETWNERAWLLTLIVSGNNLDALGEHALYSEHARPAEMREG